MASQTASVHLRGGALLLVVAVLLSACGSLPTRYARDENRDELMTRPVAENYDYRLGPGDRLSVKVFGQSDVSGEFEIGGDGSVAMPLVGQVPALNRTVGEFRDLVTKILDEKYIVDPKVSVEVTNYRPFFILGQVNNAGSFPYRSGMNMRMAVALAGGYTRRASEEPMIVIRRDEHGELSRYWAHQDTPVLPGDTIEVRRRVF